VNEPVTAEAAISHLPPRAARMAAIEILLAEPESLGDDVLETCLYILRDRLREGDVPEPGAGVPGTTRSTEPLRTLRRASGGGRLRAGHVAGNGMTESCRGSAGASTCGSGSRAALPTPGRQPGRARGRAGHFLVIYQRVMERGEGARLDR